MSSTVGKAWSLELYQGGTDLDVNKRRALIRINANDGVSLLTPAIDTVLVLDTSASMVDDLATVVRCVSQLVDIMPDGSRVAFVEFNDKLKVTEFTELSATSRRKLKTDLSQMKVDGMTNMLLPMRKTQELFACLPENPTRTRVAMFLTDGGHNDGGSYDEVQAAGAAMGDLRMYYLGVGPAHDAWILKRMALPSPNQTYMACSNFAEMSDNFATIMNNLLCVAATKLELQVRAIGCTFSYNTNSPVQCSQQAGAKLSEANFKLADLAPHSSRDVPFEIDLSNATGKASLTVTATATLLNGQRWSETQSIEFSRSVPPKVNRDIDREVEREAVADIIHSAAILGLLFEYIGIALAAIQQISEGLIRHADEPAVVVMTHDLGRCRDCLLRAQEQGTGLPPQESAMMFDISSGHQQRRFNYIPVAEALKFQHPDKKMRGGSSSYLSTPVTSTIQRQSMDTYYNFVRGNLKPTPLRQVPTPAELEAQRERAEEALTQRHHVQYQAVQQMEARVERQRAAEALARSWRLPEWAYVTKARDGAGIVQKISQFRDRRESQMLDSTFMQGDAAKEAIKKANSINRNVARTLDARRQSQTVNASDIVPFSRASLKQTPNSPLTTWKPKPEARRESAAASVVPVARPIYPRPTDSGTFPFRGSATPPKATSAAKPAINTAPSPIGPKSAEEPARKPAASTVTKRDSVTPAIPAAVRGPARLSVVEIMAGHQRVKSSNGNDTRNGQAPEKIAAPTAVETKAESDAEEEEEAPKKLTKNQKRRARKKARQAQAA